MKRFSAVILLAVAFALGSMIFLHRQTVRQHDALQARIELLQQRQGPIREMTVAMEKYRRMSAHFRKMTPPEMDQAKDALRKTMNENIADFEKLDATPEEATTLEGIRHDLDSMTEFAVKFERTAFNKDAYQKAEMVALHEQIAKALNQLDDSTRERVGAIDNESKNVRDHATPLLFALGGVILLLFVVNFTREYWSYERPLRRMYGYSSALRAGAFEIQKMVPIPGRFGEIQTALAHLGQMVQGHARERHKFILDVVSDLRAPLVMLMEGRHLLGQSGQSLDGVDELRAVDSVRRGIAMLSGSLEDMEDIVEYSRLDSRLEESLIDFSELVNEVSRRLNAGPGLEKQISTSVPPMPIWVRVDARRIERVLMQMITKVASTLHSGTAIHISVSQPTHGSFRGVEVLVQDVERSRDQGRRAAGSGPEIDVTKHWISEKGLGMTLAQRVVKSQGGTLTASGTPGTTVQIALRLPQERLAQVGLISPPRGLEVKLNSLARQSRTDLGDQTSTLI